MGYPGAPRSSLFLAVSFEDQSEFMFNVYMEGSMHVIGIGLAGNYIDSND